MKRFLITLFLMSVLFPLVVAQGNINGCELDVTLVDQDPFPAIPGEYVELVFQVTGVDNPSCGTITFQLEEKFPLIFDPGFEGFERAESGYFIDNFRSFWVIPFKVRTDSNTLKGKNDMEAILTTAKGAEIFDFELDIKDTRTDFEISIKDYNSLTQTLTFEILNIGENDIEALTIEIPKQENLEVKGSKRNIVGSLDSNEDSTFSFEAKPKNGEISLTIIYTDTTNERRMVEKSILYDSSYFTNRAGDTQQKSISFYILIAVVLFFVGKWGYKRWKKNKSKSTRH